MSVDLTGAGAPARTTDYRPPSLLSVYRVRAVVELKTFMREREAVVFTFAFPVLLLVIFGAVFGRQDVDGGVTFAQVFVAGMIAAGLFASSFQNLGISIPIERDSGALKRLAGTPMPPSAYFVGKIVLVAVVATGAAGAAARGRRALLRAGPADRGQPLADLPLGQRARHLGLHDVRHRDHRVRQERPDRAGGDLADRDRAAVHLRRVLRLRRAAAVDADDRRRSSR